MDLRLAHSRRERIGDPFAMLGLYLALLAAGLHVFGGPAVAACGVRSGTAEVAGVDERLDVSLTDGRIVRLGGLDVPSNQRGSPETASAAHRFLSALIVGREVELNLLAGRSDRRGRTIADLAIPRSQDGSGGSVAAALLSAGYARVRPEFETRGCSVARLSVEDNARRAGFGIWRDPDSAVIPALDLSGLRRRDGQFVVVEGAVHSVGFGRSHLYLDLDLVPRSGLTIVVSRKLEATVARSGRQIGELAGQEIRVRGALDDRFGPRIEVTDPAMIEILSRSATSEEESPRP